MSQVRLRYGHNGGHWTLAWQVILCTDLCWGEAPEDVRARERSPCPVSLRKVKMKDVDRVVQGNKVKCGNCSTTDIVQQEGRELRSTQTNALAIVNTAMNCRTI